MRYYAMAKFTRDFEVDSERALIRPAAGSVTSAAGWAVKAIPIGDTSGDAVSLDGAQVAKTA